MTSLPQEVEANLDWNKKTWSGWRSRFQYGYDWGDWAPKQNNCDMARIANSFLIPYLGLKNLHLNILEIAPGGGRFTTELIRLSKRMHVIDISPESVHLCRERFGMYPHFSAHVGDGKSLDPVPDIGFDLVASFDSLVQAPLPVIEAYAYDSFRILNSGGYIWFDVTRNGCPEGGLLADTTSEEVELCLENIGFKVLRSHPRGEWAAIVVGRKP